MAPWDQLFAVSPSEFVEARTALVKQLRAAGKDEDAHQVAAMRRPSAALWVVNQLARRAPDQVRALVDATRRMRSAHGKGAGDELRGAMREQNEAAQAIRRAADQAAGEIGAEATPAFLRRVLETAQAAAVSDPSALRAGTLTEELAPSGFDALVGTKVAAPPARPSPVAASGVSEKPPARSEDPGRRARDAGRADQARKQEIQRLTKELREAERAAAALTARADKAEEQARRARKTAEEAQEEAVAARGRAEDAVERASALREKRARSEEA